MDRSMQGWQQWSKRLLLWQGHGLLSVLLFILSLCHFFGLPGHSIGCAPQRGGASRWGTGNKYTGSKAARACPGDK